jgi:hypothetical protein
MLFQNSTFRFYVFILFLMVFDFKSSLKSIKKTLDKRSFFNWTVSRAGRYMGVIPNEYFYTPAGPMLLLQGLFMLADAALSSRDFLDVLIFIGGQELVLYLESKAFLTRSLLHGTHAQRLPFGNNQKTRFFTYMLFNSEGERYERNKAGSVQSESLTVEPPQNYCAVCLSSNCGAGGVWQEQLTLECGHSFHRYCITKVLLFDLRQAHREKNKSERQATLESTCSVVRCPLCRKVCMWDKNVQLLPANHDPGDVIYVSTNNLMKSLLSCVACY